MKKIFCSNSYNNLLFNGSRLRRFIHLSRFYWLRNTIKKYNIKFKNVLEIGCGDGKTIEFLPLKNFNYYGLDANWNNSLNFAKEHYSNKKNIKFDEVLNAKDIKIAEGKYYDLVICMETLEHISPDQVCLYLEKIAQHCKGYFLITVPNEKGLFFLLKRIIKLNSDNYKYNLKEILQITLGKTNKVKRFQHKGFDYDHLIYDIKKYFKIVKVEGNPMGKFFPIFLCFNICIIAKFNDLQD